jgi:Flp pilus assembly pilin Flp
MNYVIRMAVDRFKLLARNTQGQDMIEYALMAGFVAVAAGAIMPNFVSTISVIFSQVTSVLTTAGSQS